MASLASNASAQFGSVLHSLGPRLGFESAQSGSACIESVWLGFASAWLGSASGQCGSACIESVWLGFALAWLRHYRIIHHVFCIYA